MTVTFDRVATTRVPGFRSEIYDLMPVSGILSPRRRKKGVRKSKMCSQFFLSSNEHHTKAYLQKLIDLFLDLFIISFLYYARVFGKGKGW